MRNDIEVLLKVIKEIKKDTSIRFWKNYDNDQLRNYFEGKIEAYTLVEKQLERILGDK